jgi:hypothetical protein
MSTRARIAIGLVCGLASLLVAAPAGAYVYWANVNVDKGIGRANLDGSGVNQSFVPDAPTHGPCGVAVDSQHLYWANYGFFEPSFMLDTTIGRANLDGSGANQSFIAGAKGPCGVAVDASHIYWANEGGAFSLEPGSTIGRANLDGSGANQTFIRKAATPCGVAVDANHVYWANLALGTIGRASLSGEDADESFITGANHPCGVAVDANHVYWANSGWGPSYPTGSTIGRANLDGSGVNQSFITGAAGPSGVAVDSQHLYWANTQYPPSTIGRANLDGSGVDQAFIGANSNPDGVAVDVLGGSAQPLRPAHPAIAGRFKLLKLKHFAKRGTALLVVHVGGPGMLALFGRKVRLAKQKASAAGNVKLKVRPKRSARRRLRQVHKLRSWVKIRFTPQHGTPYKKSKPVTLFLK